MSTHIEMNSLSLLHLMHSASPALPIGAFAYSQGLEYALESEWCKTANDVEDWLSCILQHGIATLDLPVLLRLQKAWSDHDYPQLNYWNATLLAFRETKELYEEDIQVGEAFKQWHLKQHPEQLDKLAVLAQSVLEQPTVAAMFSLNSTLNHIEAEASLLGYSWSWLENQIAAASKAMPMGQTDGQRILQKLIPVIVASVEHAQALGDEDIGSSCMGQAMASALHEQQYSRLFRS